MPADASPRRAGEGHDPDWARAGSLAGTAALLYTLLAWCYQWRIFGWITPTVVHAISPVLIALKQHAGQAYAHAFGRVYIILLAGLAGLAALWPIRWQALPHRPSLVVAACAVLPIVIINACLLERSLLLFTMPHLLAFGLFAAIALRWPPTTTPSTPSP